MDPLKARLFIKGLNYDLNTVQLLLDYDRTKETLSFIEKILDNIDSFRASSPGNDLNNIFSEKFWDKKLPGSMSFLEMRTHISQFAHTKTAPVENDLEKIEYRKFVQNVFVWSESNISKIRHEFKSPARKKLEKSLFFGALSVAGFCILIFMAWSYFTWDWGLKGDFYQGMNFEKYIFTGYKKTINFSTPEEMDFRLPHDNFSARWQGNLLVPKDGEYSIFVASDDGDKVFIDRKLIIEDWSEHGAEDLSKKIFLLKGPHKITLEYFQIINDAVLKLFWAIDGGKKEIIPAKYLRH